MRGCPGAQCFSSSLFPVKFSRVADVLGLHTNALGHLDSGAEGVYGENAIVGVCGQLGAFVQEVNVNILEQWITVLRGVYTNETCLILFTK